MSEEYRIARLESDVRRQGAEIERLKDALWLIKDRQRNWALLAGYFVVTAVLLAALWRGFGWI